MRVRNGLVGLHGGGVQRARPRAEGRSTLRLRGCCTLWMLLRSACQWGSSAREGHCSLVGVPNAAKIFSNWSIWHPKDAKQQVKGGSGKGSGEGSG